MFVPHLPWKGYFILYCFGQFSFPISEAFYKPKQRYKVHFAQFSELLFMQSTLISKAVVAISKQIFWHWLDWVKNMFVCSWCVRVKHFHRHIFSSLALLPIYMCCPGIPCTVQYTIPHCLRYLPWQKSDMMSNQLKGLGICTSSCRQIDKNVFLVWNNFLNYQVLRLIQTRNHGLWWDQNKASSSDALLFAMLYLLIKHDLWLEKCSWCDWLQ